LAVPIEQAAIAATAKVRIAKFLMLVFMFIIWTPPDVQGLFGVMIDRLGCRFISGLLCRP
jgi:hypothetical protein